MVPDEVEQQLTQGTEDVDRTQLENAVKTSTVSLVLIRHGQ